jgi:conserved oligomeric Golgi complex subunit 2
MKRLNLSTACKTIFPGALHALHSPFIPQTPFPAFTSQTDPFDAELVAARRLDEIENPLAVLYNNILAFVERDLKHIMDIAERIGARIGQEADRGVDGGVNARGFEILANVVWAEVARALMDELGSTLFAAGRPDEFLRVGASS